jgi:hypothetical protein
MVAPLLIGIVANVIGAVISGSASSGLNYIFQKINRKEIEKGIEELGKKIDNKTVVEKILINEPIETPSEQNYQQPYSHRNFNTY